MIPRKSIKVMLVVFSIMLCSCAIKEKKAALSNKAEKQYQITRPEEMRSIEKAPLFQQTQDSLRAQLLKSKPSEILKSSALAELYIRGFVNQVGNKINFELPFNLHRLDCGAPDCYTTYLTFEIPAEEPFKLPKTIDFKFRKYGCDIQY